MFLNVDDVNKNWITTQHASLADSFLLFDNINKDNSARLKSSIETLKSADSEKKNIFYKDLFFVKSLFLFNRAIIEAYEDQSNNEFFYYELTKRAGVVINLIDNFFNYNYTYAPFPNINNINIVNKKVDLILDEVADLSGTDFDFNIDDDMWLNDLRAAKALIDFDDIASKLVKNFVSYLVPLRSNSNSNNVSFSSRGLPNVIFKNNEGSSYIFAETLIHEADHQYFYLLETDASFWSSNDARLNPIYYSPWRDDPRPLDGIIRGLSAFARVCHYYFILVTNEHGDEGLLMELLLNKLLQCENALKTLVASNQLSSFGKSYVSDINRVIKNIDLKIKYLPIYHRCKDEASDLLHEHKKRWKKNNKKNQGD